MRFLRSIAELRHALARAIVESAEDVRPKLFVFAVFCFFGFPLYYWVWGYVFPQPYENLGLRIAGMCVVLPALFVRFWPPAIDRWVALYWYAATVFCAPFFFTYMMLANGINEVWSAAEVIIVVLVVVLFDFLNALFLLALGMSAAFLCYGILGEHPIPWGPFLVQLPIYGFAMATAGIFNRAMARETRAKIGAAMALGGHLAHELRTPLAAIRAAASLIDAAQPRHAAAGESSGTGASGDASDLLRNAPATIVREVDHAYLVIDLALINTGVRPHHRNTPTTIGLMAEVASAIDRYPFKDPRQRGWIAIDARVDFEASVVPLLFDHVLFNLIKNAVYAIRAAGRSDDGRIRIWAETGGAMNRLHVRDNGEGMPSAVAARVFSPFFSTRPNGTGLGLHFCRTVMAGFGGCIHCRSSEGEGTEMILELPPPPPSPLRPVVPSHPPRSSRAELHVSPALTQQRWTRA